MKLYSRAFERELRRGIKQAVDTSAALKREYRRANKYRRHYSSGPLVRLALSVGLALAVWKCTDQTGHATTGLAVLTLWTSWFTLVRSSKLTATLAESSDTAALGLLPISDRDIFHLQIQTFVRSSLWSLVDSLAALVLLGVALEFSLGRYLALPVLALLVWATQQSLAALCAVRLPRLAQMLMMGAFAVCAAVFFFNRWFQLDLLRILDRHGESVSFVLPTGWPLSIFDLLTNNQKWWLIGFLLPTILILLSAKDSLAKLEAGFSYKETVQPAAPDLPPDGFVATQAIPRNAGGSEDGDPVLRVGVTQVVEIIQSRQFLKPREYDQSQWFERRLWNWFSARERTLAEFAFPDGFQITKPWLKVIRNLTIAVVSALALRTFSPGTAWWLLVCGVVVTGLRVLFLVFMRGRAFQAVFSSGVNIPLYAAYPAGFREVSRMLFKCTLVQALPILLFATAAAMLICVASEVTLTAGLVFGIKAALLLPAARGFALALAFSSGTNDTANVTLRSLVRLGPMLCGGLIFLGLSGAGLFVPDQRASWGLTGVALLAAYGFYQLYGWLYHRNRFDLMSVPQRQ